MGAEIVPFTFINGIIADDDRYLGVSLKECGIIRIQIFLVHVTGKVEGVKTSIHLPLTDVTVHERSKKVGKHVAR